MAILTQSVDAARPRNAYELHIVTNVPPNQTNALRGRTVYARDPRAKGERVLVFAEEGSDAAVAAAEAQAQLQARGSSMNLLVGGQEMINDTVAGRVPAFHRVLCTPALLPALAKPLARTLGPKGLMPSAKRGTVIETTEETQRAINEMVSGVDWRSDRVGVVRSAVGRISFSEADLRGNVQQLLDSVIERVASGLAGTKASAKVVEGYARDVPADATGSALLRRSPGRLKRGTSIYLRSHVDHRAGAPQLHARPRRAAAARGHFVAC